MRRLSLLPTRVSGFTLVEVLIVITIVGIMMALIGSNFVRTQRVARDTTRRTQVKAIQDALEQFYANAGTYTNGCDTANLATYIPGGMPQDPGTNLLTCTITSATSYCVAATLEETTSGTCDASCSQVVNGPAVCATNLQ